MFRPLAILALMAAPAWAQQDHDHGNQPGHEGHALVGDIHLSHMALRATPPNAPVAGGFLVIENRGEVDDVLVAATIDAGVAGRIELHEMALEEGVMRMFEVEGGIPLPAGETVTLAPGGLHLMLMGLPRALEAGGSHEVALTFAHAGEAVATFPVLTLGEIRAIYEEAGRMEADHGGHGGHGDHGGHGN